MNGIHFVWDFPINNINESSHNRKLVDDIITKIDGDLNNKYLMHYGILGQKWGIRRYQNMDGSLTQAGIERYRRTTNIPELKNSEVYNMSKWGQDENHNVLYITGYSGSGKSTISEKLARLNKARVIHLDGFTEYGAKDDTGIRDKDFVNYLDKNMRHWKHLYESSPDNPNPPIKPYSKEYWDLVDEFRSHIDRYSKKKFKEGERVIVEGIQLMDDWWDGGKYDFENKPVIILSTNKLVSTKRAFDRDDRDIFNLGNWKTAMKNAKTQRKAIKRIKRNINK